eukprot:11173671-Lingulodinium_polyedra.AAC.1
MLLLRSQGPNPLQTRPECAACTGEGEEHRKTGGSKGNEADERKRRGGSRERERASKSKSRSERKSTA